MSRRVPTATAAHARDVHRAPGVSTPSGPAGAAGAVPAEAVLDHVGDGADVIVPLANGEPVTRPRRARGGGAAGRFRGVRVHQMHALHDRPYLHGTMRDAPAARVVLPVAT